jgi:hypothetical protein
VLSSRALNRALLHRQHLLDRVDRPVLDVVEHLVGLQAQEPADPYVGLWCRVAGFDPAALSGLLESRAAVRIGLQRGTIHLVSAADCVALRPVLQPVLERLTRGQFGRKVAGVDPAELAAAARECLAAGPLTWAELGRQLAVTWPDREPNALAQTARALLPLAQLPPRGLWGRSGRAVHGLADAWLGRLLATDPAPDRLVLRYLAAYGPATVADVQNWSGLTRLAEVVDRLPVRRLGDGLLDVPDGPLPSADLPAPVRFLPQFDNVLLGHADRSRIVPAAAAGLHDEQFHWSPVLIDGLLRGVWRRDKVGLHVRAPGLSAAERSELEAEGHALLDLYGQAGDVRLGA